MEYRTMEQALEAAKGMTFEKYWAAMDERSRRVDKEMEEMREAQREAQREAEKEMKELREAQKETSKQIGGLNNSQGRLTEAMFSAGLFKKFRDIGFDFTKQAERFQYSEDGRVFAEVDLFLEDGEYIMLVEIKTNLSVDDVNHHLEKLGKIRKHMDARNDRRKIVGAVAGGTVLKNVLEYAHRKGLYVVVQSGDAVKIAGAPENFKAREW